MGKGGRRKKKGKEEVDEQKQICLKYKDVPFAYEVTKLRRKLIGWKFRGVLHHDLFDLLKWILPL